MKYFDRVPIVSIIRGVDSKSLVFAVEAAIKGGLHTLEITLNRPDAFEQITAIKAKFGADLELGAGTVLNVASAVNAIEAGAEYIVTPALLPEVIEFCRSKSVPVFPGAMTPTEILFAHRAGAEMVKVFPANVLGPNYIKSLKGPFPDIRLLPTGGVTVENIPEYLRAGASGFGIGGELFNRDWIEHKNWTAIEKTAKSYVEAMEAAR
jgi:2-dehydro-3-deoxyphosphogluconate aldolase / (4S)-4-hydroxy-2-oxoglutarate aldolase